MAYVDAYLKSMLQIGKSEQIIAGQSVAEPKTPAQKVAQDVIGMTEAAAIAHATKNGVRFEVWARDDQDEIVTADISKNRVRVSIMRGHVAESEVC